MENLIEILTTEITVPFWYCLVIIIYSFRNICLFLRGLK